MITFESTRGLAAGIGSTHPAGTPPQRTGSNAVGWRSRSQTIKTATQGKTTGYDAGKKKGRKRHLLVDTSGLLRQVVVTAADVEDRESRC